MLGNPQKTLQCLSSVSDFGGIAADGGCTRPEAEIKTTPVQCSGLGPLAANGKHCCTLFGDIGNSCWYPCQLRALRYVGTGRIGIGS